MTTKLVQKQLLSGSREFEITDDILYVRIKSLLKEQQLSVDLSTLDPEPVINGSELEFFNPHKGRTVFSLLLNKPNSKEFNAFVSSLKQAISGETTESVSAEKAQSALAMNMHEEPPEFTEAGRSHEKAAFEPIIVERLSEDIDMLNTYVKDDEIKPLMSALETLKTEPDNEAAYNKAFEAFNNLGITQGAVLTYAHYFKVLVSESMD